MIAFSVDAPPLLACIRPAGTQAATRPSAASCSRRLQACGAALLETRKACARSQKCAVVLTLFWRVCACVCAATQAPSASRILDMIQEGQCMALLHSSVFVLHGPLTVCEREPGLASGCAARRELCLAALADGIRMCAFLATVTRETWTTSSILERRE